MLTLPDGRECGSTAGIDIGPDGHLGVYDRCGGGLDGGCDANPEANPVFKFDRETGEVLTSFGAPVLFNAATGNVARVGPVSSPIVTSTGHHPSASIPTYRNPSAFLMSGTMRGWHATCLSKDS